MSDGERAVTPRVMTRCERAGRSAWTGLLMSRRDLDRLDRASRTMKCPACDEDHAWSPGSAWISYFPADVDVDSGVAR